MKKGVHTIGLIVATLFVLTGCSTRAVPPTPNVDALLPETFASPAAAVSRLTQVVATGDATQAQKLLGSDGDYLLKSGDPALDKARASRFSDLFKERHELRAEGDDRYVMLLGSKGWPFPVPLVKEDNTWFFDANVGREEILARRIGENEFSTLDTLRAVYLAQRRYAAQDWNGDGVYHYAERLISTPGNRDGLYWPRESKRDESSPLAATVAKAAQENYSITSGGHPQPFHGYYYKLRYTPVAAGEKTDALSKPGRYWLISTPAVWNESGVVTFALNERGWIYEKNLGADVVPERIAGLRIDDSWTRVE